MVNFHMGKNTMLFVNPIYLLLLAPNYIPVSLPSLFPLPANKTIIYCIFEGGFEFDITPEWDMTYGGIG